MGTYTSRLTKFGLSFAECERGVTISYQCQKIQFKFNLVSHRPKRHLLRREIQSWYYLTSPPNAC